MSTGCPSSAAGYRACASASQHLYAHPAIAYVTTNVKALSMCYRSFDNDADAEA